MAWRSLSQDLSNKPRVLAGPLLRKVTPNDVTVWLACRVGGTVRLKLLDASGGVVMDGRRHTVAIGAHLHIVAVTAKTQPPAGALTEGVIYRYDLTFDFDDNLSTNLATATANAILAYPPFTQPTFCMPPKDINRLRLLHGSCRIPHGNGKDALAIADDLIAQAAQTPELRPHQLFLTGDQIYADDVAASMLIMLSDASDVLLGWKEKLTLPSPAYDGIDTGSQLSPFMRRELLDRSGFTSEDLDGHLITLGEYIAMYLFVWSDVLWSSTTIPLFQDVIVNLRQNLGVEHVPPGVLPPNISIDSDVKNMIEFRNALPNVRRALANIPSYMIMDDHEVTDDWNMTLDIAKGMYKPLGVRIVQNGLVAYALCQHWGNAPEQFEDVGQAPPGLTVLRLLERGDAASYEQNSPSLCVRVGVHDAAAVASHKAVFHDANSLIYNYAVEGAGHQVIFTDTRTWRSFPFGADEGGELLPLDQFQKQILNTPPTGDRALLVVVSTNAPPVQPIRTATRHSTIANAAEHFPDIFEAWELPSRAIDRLFKALSDKLPLVSGERHGPAMLLSGDVHTSFASRMLFKGSARYEDPQNGAQRVTAVYAQLVASSLRKQTGGTLGFHRDGYTYTPHLKRLIPPHIPEGYAGWNLPPGPKQTVGRTVFHAGSTVGWAPLKLTGPSTVPISDDTSVVQYSRPPDYKYRLDYLLANSEGYTPTPPAPLPPIPSGATVDQRKQAADAFLKAAGNYRTYNAKGPVKREMVGVNNVCEITFDWGAGDKRRVNHTVRWRDPMTQMVMFTNYAVNLDPDDPNFPDLPMTQVPP